jgi:hypothetical protein
MNREVNKEDVRNYLQSLWDTVERVTNNGASNAVVDRFVARYMDCEIMARELIGVDCYEKDGIVYINE